MKKLTISEIKAQLKQINDKNNPFLIELYNDERKGVQNLLKSWEKAQLEQEKLRTSFKQMSKYEIELRNKSYNYIAGIDEVGRGPLAGPVVAAAVILPEQFELLGLNDSKTLSEQKRNFFFTEINKNAIAIGIGIVEPAEIDKINIYEATKQAMLRAVGNLSINPEYLLIDAMTLKTEIPQQSIIKGDANSISIAAASVVAKVTRDEIMKKIGKDHPEYKFENNMGYGTKEHLQAIEQHGITTYHRRSFAPICNK